MINQLNMKEKTIDYVLRTTWLAVQKMYNEEAAKFEATMATAFTLLSIDPKKEHLPLRWDLKWEWNLPVCQES